MIFKRRNVFLLTAVLLISTAGLGQVPKKAELVSINGKNLYYEVYGGGKPLIILHGYSLSSQAWKPYVQDYAGEFEVYLIDLTGHGKSDPFSEELSIPSVALDLQGLLRYLNIERTQAIGFSFGGDVLYQLALLDPALLKSMITIGAVGSWDVTAFPEYQEFFVYENLDELPWMLEYHESEERIRGILEQFNNYTVYVTNEQLEQIEPEVLIVMGDDDEGISFEEVARTKRYLPKSDLWVLPNVSHAAHEGATREEFIRISKSFLNR
jgi:pimeloyl-ACP methyl ester carboxylesterase